MTPFGWITVALIVFMVCVTAVIIAGLWADKD